MDIHAHANTAHPAQERREWFGSIASLSLKQRYLVHKLSKDGKNWELVASHHSVLKMNRRAEIRKTLLKHVTGVGKRATRLRIVNNLTDALIHSENEDFIGRLRCLVKEIPPSNKEIIEQQHSLTYLLSERITNGTLRDYLLENVSIQGLIRIAQCVHGAMYKLIKEHC